jgi:hypothetical protein
VVDREGGLAELRLGKALRLFDVVTLIELESKVLRGGSWEAALLVQSVEDAAWLILNQVQHILREARRCAEGHVFRVSIILDV